MRELAACYLFRNSYACLWDRYLLYCFAFPVERIARDSKKICEDNTETLREHCCEDKIDTAIAAMCYFAPPICCLAGSGLFCSACVASCPVVSLTTGGLFGYNTIKAAGCEACLTNPEPVPSAAPAQQNMDDEDIGQLAAIDQLLHFPGAPFTL